jgi:hypothetical protein
MKVILNLEMLFWQDGCKNKNCKNISEVTASLVLSCISLKVCSLLLPHFCINLYHMGIGDLNRHTTGLLVGL